MEDVLAAQAKRRPLDLDNLGPFFQAAPGVLEESVGQALVADALHLGLGTAVRAYLSILRAAVAVSE